MLLAALLPGAMTPGQASGPDVRVAAAYDLFQTNSSLTFYGPFHFRGVQGCPMLPEAENTDTIVQRKQDATPASPVVEIEALCLQLEAEYLQVGDAVTPAAGVYVTLQSDRGRHPTDAMHEARAPGQRSLGTITFDFLPSGCGGTFDSVLDVHFDIRSGSVNGPIVYSSDETTSPHFTSEDTPWGCATSQMRGGFVDRGMICVRVLTKSICAVTDQHGVNAPADLIPGVNFRMDGASSAQDFFPMELAG